MKRELQTIGRAEFIGLPEHDLEAVPARIDTGARTSALWVSRVSEKNGKLSFVLFDKTSPLYSGKVITTSNYGQQMVTSSMGNMEERYTVKLRTVLNGRKILATFTLANRATQTYPVLVGRNILRGKFIVDVKQGKPLVRRKDAQATSLKSEKTS